VFLSLFLLFFLLRTPVKLDKSPHYSIAILGLPHVFWVD
jgi:hypothetical protein